MTERRTNRLLTVGDAERPHTGHPYDLDAYCGWLNAKEHRRGRWLVVPRNGARALDWVPELATDDWLRVNGLVPKIGQAA